MSPARTPAHRRRDPVVLAGSLAGAAAMAWVLFAGAYLPYVDWSNHLGLIAVLAHGDRTGAELFFERSLAPTPYLLFYAVTAALAQLFPVSVAAKLSLVLAAGAMVPAAAALAEATGRSPRAALVAPLALFGFPFGYGFASYVFATPLLLAALAAGERTCQAAEDDPRALRRQAAALGLTLGLVYLGHALLFALAVGLLGARLALALARARRGRARLLAAALFASLPAAALVAATALKLGDALPPDTPVAADGRLFVFTPLADHVRRLGGSLLERGSAAHWTTMRGVALLFGAHLVATLAGRRLRAPAADGLGLLAALLVALYFLGPESLVYPTELWMLYPRVATLAALLVFLSPRVDLGGRAGLASAAVALGLVAHGAHLNRGHVLRFDRAARGYDAVRATVPPGARVLALSVPDAGDPMRTHPSLGALHFHHLEDGARYGAFLFDHPLLPVRARPAVRPRAPHWRRPWDLDLEGAGRDHDYLVLRGSALRARARGAASHRPVLDHAGWLVLRTVAPRPLPALAGGAAAR